MTGGLCAVVLTACINDSEADQEIAFDSVSEGTWSGITNQRAEVISTIDELYGFWLDLMAGVSPAADVPLVDFGQYLVIAVVAREGAYGLVITRIEPKDGRGAVVHMTEEYCSASCPPVVLRPYHVVRIARGAVIPMDFVFYAERYCFGG